MISRRAPVPCGPTIEARLVLVKCGDDGSTERVVFITAEEYLAAMCKWGRAVVEAYRCDLVPRERIL